MVILLALLAGCPRPLPPALPASTVSPLDPPVPPRLPPGRTAGVVSIPLVPLEVDLFEQGPILAALAASPDWRVTQWSDSVVAFRRRDGTVGRHGEANGSRVLLRTLSWPHGHPWDEDGVPTLSSELLLAPVELRVTAEGVASALVVDGGELDLEVHEVGPDPERPLTRAALAELAAIRGAGVPPTRGAGVPPALDAIEVTAVGPGELEVRARANPGRPGWTWLRILRGGEPWAEEAVAVGSREAIGWSAEAEGFYLQGRFFVPPGPAFRAVAELWFLASDAEAPERLRRRRVTIPAR